MYGTYARFLSPRPARGRRNVRPWIRSRQPWRALSSSASTPRRTASPATSASSRRWARCWSAAASCTTATTRSCASSARSRAASSASPASRRRWSTPRRRRRTCCREIGRMLEGRVLVAHSAAFDRRVLRQAFERAGLAWPDPPSLCTVAMARRFAPLATQRKLAALAGTLGIEVEAVHRALVDAETCARVFCALFPKLCASVGSVADAVALLAPAPRARGPRAEAGAGRPARGAPGPERAARRSRRLRVPRRARPASLRGQVGVGARRGPARTSARRPAGPSAPRSSTTSPPRRSSARSCSRTG